MNAKSINSWLMIILAVFTVFARRFMNFIDVVIVQNQFYHRDASLHREDKNSAGFAITLVPSAL